MRKVHFEIEMLYETAYTSACGAYSEKHEYTDRDEHVTCPKCLKALGYTIVD